MTDKLVVIEPKDLPSLKVLYEKDESNGVLASMAIDNYIQWIKQDPNVTDINFLCLNGDFSDGTFVVIASVFSVIT